MFGPGIGLQVDVLIAVCKRGDNWECQRIVLYKKFQQLESNASCHLCARSVVFPKKQKNDKVFIYIQCFWLQFRNQVLFLFFQIPVIFVIATAMCFICMLIPDGKNMLEIKSLNIMSMIIVNSCVLSTRKRISYRYLYYNLLLKELWKGVYFT